MLLTIESVAPVSYSTVRFPLAVLPQTQTFLASFLMRMLPGRLRRVGSSYLFQVVRGYGEGVRSMS